MLAGAMASSLVCLPLPLIVAIRLNLMHESYYTTTQLRDSYSNQIQSPPYLNSPMWTGCWSCFPAGCSSYEYSGPLAVPHIPSPAFSRAPALRVPLAPSHPMSPGSPSQCHLFREALLNHSHHSGPHATPHPQTASSWSCPFLSLPLSSKVLPDP